MKQPTIKNKRTLPLPDACPKRHRFISKKFRVRANVVLSVREMANILANYNHYNRPRTAPWQEYCNEIKSGNFRYDVGHVIKFDKKGNLMDGSHRMFAHWVAGVPFPTIVIYGLPSDAILYMDGNATRKSCVGPVLLESIEAQSPVVKEKFKVRSYQLSLSRLMLLAEANWAGSAPNGLRQERYFQANKKVINSSMVGVQFYKLRRELCWTRRPGARAAIALYAKRFPKKAEKFLTSVYSTGSEILSGSPVDLLRKALISPALKGGSQMYSEFRLAMEAIQAYHQGQRFMKSLPERYQWDF